MSLNRLDRVLLERLQQGLPLVPRPFLALGQEKGVGEGEVLERVRGLREGGFIRYLGGIFNPLALGYRTALVALEVEPARLGEAAAVISAHPGVSHNYAREHRYNLWFTLSLPSHQDLEGEAQELGERAGARDVLFLPTLKVFKLGALFSPSGTLGTLEGGQDHDWPSPLLPLERQVVLALQQDLPLEPAPFAPLARNLGIGEGAFLDLARGLLERGVMRRFGALVRHRNLGFRANALVCWDLPPERMEGVGKRLASLLQVSHCYQRPSYPHWPYSLYAMFHAPRRETCRALARQLSRELWLDNYLLLFSAREYKKEGIRYFL